MSDLERIEKKVEEMRKLAAFAAALSVINAHNQWRKDAWRRRVKDAFWPFL